jgi:glucosamine 6-phosphate synthetase-like amidotransferase/phosphosugar isomerase protein
MYAKPPANARTRHPYFMYEEIKLQPEAVARSLSLAEEQGAEAVQTIARGRRIFLTGCGTSFHAAQVGAWFFQYFSQGKIDARAVQAYELVTYLPGLRPDDVVVGVSHSGTTTMTRRALDRARRAGADTVLVTGFPEGDGAVAGRAILPTGYGEEKSWAHTASYTAAVTSLAALANALAEPAERLDLSPLPDVVREAVRLEEMAHRVAASTILVERYREPARIVLVGGGPNVATAQEGALKLQETSYVPAAAFELEEMLHGPLAAVTSDTLLVILAPAGASIQRTLDLMRAARELETVPVVLGGGDTIEAFDVAHRLVLPDLPEVLSPIPYVVPLQLFSYFLAVGKDINPDLLHRDDERYRAARAQYE